MNVRTIDVLAQARSLPPFSPQALGEVAGATLALARGGADGEMPLWHVSEHDELQFCAQGSCRFLLRVGDREMAPVDASAGQLVVVPAGVGHKVLASEDTVVLNVCVPDRRSG